MSREIDERKKRKALRRLRKAAELAARGEGPELSDWERTFLEEVEERIETFGSAFADPEKGNLDDPMSALQAQKLKEIGKKARGKETGFKTRKPLGWKKKQEFAPRVRQLDEDIAEDTPPPPEPEAKPTRPPLGVVRASDLSPRPKPAETPRKPEPDRRAAFRVIKGGKDDA